MKIFHLSDLHIGKLFYQYSLLEDQQYIFKQIISLAREEKPEVIIIAGDLYDKSVPSAEAVHVCNEFLTELCHLSHQPDVMIIAGNHDSAERLDFASSLLEKQHLYIASMPPAKGEQMKSVIKEDAYGRVIFHLCPFMKPPYIRHLFEEDCAPQTYQDMMEALIQRESFDSKTRHVIVAHQFFVSANGNTETCDSELLQIGGLDQIDVQVFAPYEYAALGHIHGPQFVSEEKYRYCGTPLKYSVSEASHNKSLTMVELKAKGEQAIITQLPLKPLRDVRKITGKLASVIDERNGQISDDYVSITLTDEEEQIDARVQLLNLFPRLLEIRIDNQRTRQASVIEFQMDVLQTPELIFKQFFEGIHGRELSEQEQKVMETVFKSMKDEAQI